MSTSDTERTIAIELHTADERLVLITMQRESSHYGMWLETGSELPLGDPEGETVLATFMHQNGRYEVSGDVWRSLEDDAFEGQVLVDHFCSAITDRPDDIPEIIKAMTAGTMPTIALGLEEDV